MEPLISRCGYRCDLCPAFKDNDQGPDHRQWVSDGWFTYYGFRIPPEDIHCDGCRADDSANPTRIDTDCPVRPCVIAKGLDNCAQCPDCVCDRLRQRLVDAGEILKRAPAPVPQSDREAFIRPYDNARRLQTMKTPPPDQA